MAKITPEFYDKENKPISEEDIFYSLKEIRQIGSGGFGVVYLVQDEDENFYALKRVYKENKNSYKKELKSIKLYRKISKNCKCKSIIQILAFREIEEGIEYLMPLADGVGKFSPTSDRWKPKTLATLIQNRYKKGGVFTTQEVLDIFSPLFEAIKFLNESGVLHRDIKPENILFFNGSTCLADIGLLREDTLTMSAAGTPLYAPPTWFLDTHGNPDVWGLASVLYYFLSGNPPDTISRINYMYPPSKRKMSKADIKAWEHFHRVILRAMRGKANERFLTIDDFFDAFKNIDEKVDKAPKTSFLKRKRKPSAATLAIPTKQETSIFSLSGRINRTTFFFAYALLGIFSVCVTYLENLWVGFIILLPIILWLRLTLFYKRVHDASLSGWVAFFLFITFIVLEGASGAFWGNLDLMRSLVNDSKFVILSLLILLALPHQRGANKYAKTSQRLCFFEKD